MRRILAWVMALALLAGVTSVACAEAVTIIGGEAAGFDEMLVVGEKIKVDGDYRIEALGANWFSDTALKERSQFVYLETSESGCASLRYDWPVGTHTPMCVSIELTNMAKEKVDLSERLVCQIVYDETYVFDAFFTQFNPDQVNKDGELWRSCDPVAVEPLYSVQVDFLSAVPFIVRDSNKPLVAMITVDDNTVYTLNLRDVIESK